jgi:hypothetical protein
MKAFLFEFKRRLPSLVMDNGTAARIREMFWRRRAGKVYTALLRQRTSFGTCASGPVASPESDEQRGMVLPLHLPQDSNSFTPSPLAP